METYFFHLRDGKNVLLDPEGRSLPSLEAVAGAALFEARAIISADAIAGKIVLNQAIEVEDRARKDRPPRRLYGRGGNQRRPAGPAAARARAKFDSAILIERGSLRAMSPTAKHDCAHRCV